MGSMLLVKEYALLKKKKKISEEIRLGKLQNTSSRFPDHDAFLKFGKTLRNHKIKQTLDFNAEFSNDPLIFVYPLMPIFF